MLDFNDVEKLIENFNNSDMRELEIDDGSFHIRLSKNDAPKAPVAYQSQVDAPAVAVSEPEAVNQVDESQADEGQTIKAPMVGTVYLKPEPDKEPYVKVGSRVHKGDIVCIIEAMKMMTEIKSDLDGVISEIVVENEDLVEFDQPLFKVTEG